MSTPKPNTAEVSIHNSENNTDWNFQLRTDRLHGFFQFLAANRASGMPQSIMPGISGPAHYALDCLFFGPKPPKFPAHDILAWIRDQQKEVLGEYPNPTVTSQEVESALGRWASTVSQLLADGSDRA